MTGKHKICIDLEMHNLHPRPQLCRANWQSLNGLWQFCFDPEQRYQKPEDIHEWEHMIEVPFAPETQRSGIGDEGFHPFSWYQREFHTVLQSGRLFLHFGAVDYGAKVWVNKHYIGSHEGGYTPFKFDITHNYTVVYF